MMVLGPVVVTVLAGISLLLSVLVVLLFLLHWNLSYRGRIAAEAQVRRVGSEAVAAYLKVDVEAGAEVLEELSPHWLPTLALEHPRINRWLSESGDLSVRALISVAMMVLLAFTMLLGSLGTDDSIRSHVVSYSALVLWTVAAVHSVWVVSLVIRLTGEAPVEVRWSGVLLPSLEKEA